MQQLMEQTPLPTLLLRTIIQSLSMYPKLKGFIMNLLLRLINKQVWKTPKLWEGFVKCCERTVPQSFQVLLQLPPPQLLNVFELSKGMRLKLLSHVETFSEHQQAHIPKSVLKVLETDPVKEKEEHEKREAEERKQKEEEELAAKAKSEEERLQREKLEKVEAEEKARAEQERGEKEEEEKARKEKEEVAEKEAAESKGEEEEEKTSTFDAGEAEEATSKGEGTPTKDEVEETAKQVEVVTPVRSGRGRGRGRGAKVAQPPPTAGVRRSSRRK